MVNFIIQSHCKRCKNYLCPSFGMSNNFSFLRSRDVRLFLLDFLSFLFFIGLLSRFCLKYSRFSISPLRNLFSGRVAFKKFATKSSFTACNKDIQNFIVVYWRMGRGNKHIFPNSTIFLYLKSKISCLISYFWIQLWVHFQWNLKLSKIQMFDSSWALFDLKFGLLKTIQKMLHTGIF